MFWRDRDRGTGSLHREGSYVTPHQAAVDFPITSTMRISVPPPANRRASCHLWLGGFLQTVFRDLLPPIPRKNKHPQG